MDEKLLSEIGKGNEYVRPETMLVIKNISYSYPAYWNQTVGGWGGLLSATVYTNSTDVPTVENGEAVDYRAITGVK